jgi:hypothetical protein
MKYAGFLFASDLCIDYVGDKIRKKIQLWFLAEILTIEYELSWGTSKILFLHITGTFVLVKTCPIEWHNSVDMQVRYNYI